MNQIFFLNMPLGGTSTIAKPNKVLQKLKNYLYIIIGLLFCLAIFIIINFVYSIVQEGELSDLNNKNKNIITTVSPKINNNEILKEMILFKDDFSNGFEEGMHVGSKWIPVSQDGILITSKNKNMEIKNGLLVKSIPFKKTFQLGSPLFYKEDHDKWVYFTNQIFPIEHSTRLEAEVQITAMIFNTTKNPFGIKNTNDPRLACVTFSSYDENTMIQNDFVLTNKMIYAAVWRHPFKRKTQGDYMSYRYLIPLKERETSNAYHKLKIVYDKLDCNAIYCKSSGGSPIVKFIIDGKEFFRIDNLGNKLNYQYMTTNFGGSEKQSVNPKKIRFGIGTSSYLNSYSTCEIKQPITSDVDVELFKCIFQDYFAPVSLPTPVKYFNPRNSTTPDINFKKDISISSKDTIFGQGAQFHLNYITVKKYY